jgi:hypothetical protein
LVVDEAEGVGFFVLGNAEFVGVRGGRAAFFVLVGKES